MDSENQKDIYCPEDDEHGVYRNICDKLCVEKYYTNHLKSQPHTKNIHKKINHFKYFHLIKCDPYLQSI